MITIKMHDKKWRLIIGDEVWEFPDLAELQYNLNLILGIKNDWGRLEK